MVVDGVRVVEREYMYLTTSLASSSCDLLWRERRYIKASHVFLSVVFCGVYAVMRGRRHRGGLTTNGTTQNKQRLVCFRVVCFDAFGYLF